MALFLPLIPLLFRKKNKAKHGDVDHPDSYRTPDGRLHKPVFTEAEEQELRDRHGYPPRDQYGRSIEAMKDNRDGVNKFWSKEEGVGTYGWITIAGIGVAVVVAGFLIFRDTGTSANVAPQLPANRLF